MKLYGYWRSSSAYRVRIMLEFKNLSYEPVGVHLLKDGGEQYAPDFMEISPLGQVPMLALKGPSGPLYLSQSMAIAEFLEDAHPTPSLLPRDPWMRARARELAEMVNAGIQPLQNLRVLRSLKASGVDSDSWRNEVMRRGFHALERRLRSSAGAYAVGDGITVADAFLVPQVYAARRFALDLDDFPLLVQTTDACLEHPAFSAAHPDRQPDAPSPEARTP